MSTSPILVAELIASAVINPEQRTLLQELQRAEPEPAEAFVEAAEAAEPDKAKRETLLQKLARMRVVERVQLRAQGRPRRAPPADPRSLQSRSARCPAIAATLRAGSGILRRTWPA